MRATQQEVKISESIFETTKGKQERGGQLQSAISREQFQAMVAAMDKMLENILRQGQINEALTRKLLVLERRLTDVAQKAGTRAIAPANADTTGQAPATAHAAVNGARASAPPASEQTITPPPAPQRDPLPIYMGDSIAMCRVLNSFRMYVDTRDTMITPQLLSTGIWEPALTRLLAQTIKGGMTVVDIGAGVGYYTLLAAAIAGPQGRVVAFEPDPRNADILERNVELNRIQERLTLHRCGVSNERKKVGSLRDTCSQQGRALFVADAAHTAAAQASLEMVTLDDAIETPVDFMKIDAAGTEALIFDGMKKLVARSPRLMVLMEFNTVAMKSLGVEPSEFHARLTQWGFRIHLVTPQATLASVQRETLVQRPNSTVFLTRQ
jgi:FkbM family methyltransferase